MAPKVLDLNAVVSNMERLLKRLLGEDIRLGSVLAADLGRVKVDPGQVETSHHEPGGECAGRHAQRRQAYS